MERGHNVGGAIALRITLKERTVRTSHVLLASAAVLLAGNAQAEQDWDAKLEAMSKQADCVVLGRVNQIVSTTYADGETVAVGRVQVQRYFKGVSDSKPLEVELRLPGRHHEVPPERDDMVLFLRKRPDSSYYEVIYRWSKRSPDRVRQAVARVDKQTRIPNMPKPPKTKDPITVSLAADDGRGRALAKVQSKRSDLVLLVQFENVSEAAHSVMPCLDGSIVQWRYPHYELEVLDAQGQPPPRAGMGRCGNVNPWRTRDFVSLRPGEVFRTRAPTYYLPHRPGTYRVCLKYTAKRDLSLKGLSLGENEKGVAELMKTVWEGTAISNWIEVRIAPDAADSGE